MEKMNLGLKIFAIAIVRLVFVQDASLSAFRIYERKNVIHAKAELAEAITEDQSYPARCKRLFFPFAKPFDILEFASYLNYIGVPSGGTFIQLRS